MMVDILNISAFNAFQKQLRTLCLTEFPCGTGTWREPEPNLIIKARRQSRKIPKFTKSSGGEASTKFSVTLRDFGAHLEKTETLEEYVIEPHSPWNLDYSWSNEAKQLRELAVQSPWLINETFIYEYFKTLRIIDKDVTDVDEALLKFTHLEELSLTCNLLQQVNSKNLPKSLQVLELCANQISDLFTLCVNPPKLKHLGLGYNKLSYLDEYITGDYWPQLLSLDLSHNDLCDLLDLIKKLSTLPKLRNLVLQGNPLCLIPGYRGYTIDSLKKLSILDDIRISADERHRYKGLSKKREFVLDEAVFVLEVKYMKGLPMPEELKNTEDQPEFPIIERKYYVQFMFLEEPTATVDVFQIIAHLNPEGSSVLDSEEFSSIAQSGVDKESEVINQEQKSDIHSIVQFSIPETTTVNQESLSESGDKGLGEEQTLDAGTIKDNRSEEQMRTPEAGVEETETKVQLSPIKTETSTWAEEINLNWTEVVTRDDLFKLREFLKQGMKFTVVEEKVLAYPADDETGTNESVKGGKGEKGKDKKDKKDDKSKEKDKGKDDKKKKGKKGEPDVEMNRTPPEYTTLATFVVPLEDFLEGEFEFENVYMKESSSLGMKTPESTVSSEKKEGKKKDGKSSPVKKPKEDKKDKEGRKSPKGKDDKKGAKDDKKAKDKMLTDGDMEDDVPQPPLEVHVSVKLHHWKTAMDLVRDEEEKARQRALKEARDAEEE